ncbi:hypothetical protein [Virgisporangium ochraceum]|uniref:Uncharacterized protein n=1 Tax=Virgisporangium ochraceum TaxID=65505 RepID=A0A8J4EK63_9ACTN|nr:hypothetical protein [Virgisporangium ochraceum]GIJ75057.1 hypothetical protein Voc01_099740 [Virgisporangium ochraceum]
MTSTPDLPTEDDIRALLNGTPAPQVGVDLEAAMRTGRRMSIRRGAARAAGGVVAVALVASLVVVARADTPEKRTTGPAAVPSQSPVSPSTSLSSVNDIRLRCPMTPLAKPAGAAGLQIDAVDPSGRFVSAHAMDDSENFTTVLWVDGVPRYLRFAASVRITSINSRGVAVGSAGDDSPTSAGWSFRYADGDVTRLQVPAGWRAYGNVTINERGDIADTIKPEDDQPEGLSKGIVWKAGSATPTIVPLPPHGQVRTITADGRLLGDIGDGKRSGANIWDLAGNVTRLPHPDGFPVAPQSTAGTYATGGLWMRGVIPRWDLTTNQLTRIPAVPDGVGIPQGMYISATGWITDGLQVAYRPDGTPVRLTAPGTTKVVNAGVTDNGDVFGTYGEPDESSTPVVWRCGSAS